MALSQSQPFGKVYALFMLKSFLIWVFTLAVCMLIVGFPMVILVVAVGSLLAVVLQSVMPVSAVLLVAGSIIGLHILGIVLASAILTFKGVHPQDVSWLQWLQDRENTDNTPVYASCPLTCSIKQ